MRRVNTRARNRTQGDGHGVGILHDGYMSEPWSYLDFDAAYKQFISPGKDLGSFLMRAAFPDVRVATAIVSFLARCQDCRDTKHEEMAKNWIAAMCSIKATRIDTLLQATVGQLHYQKQKGMFGKKKKYEEDGAD